MNYKLLLYYSNYCIFIHYFRLDFQSAVILICKASSWLFKQKTVTVNEQVLMSCELLCRNVTDSVCVDEFADGDVDHGSVEDQRL